VKTHYGKAGSLVTKNAHHQAEAGLTANYKYKWTGQDLADFISISVYTGLRMIGQSPPSTPAVCCQRRVSHPYDEKRPKGLHLDSGMLQERFALVPQTSVRSYRDGTTPRTST